MLKLPNQPENVTFYHQTMITEDNGATWHNILGNNQSFGLLHPNHDYQKISDSFSELQSLLSIVFDEAIIEVVFQQYSYTIEELKNVSNPVNSYLKAAIKTTLFFHQHEIIIPATQTSSFISQVPTHAQYLEAIFDDMIEKIKQDPAWQVFQQREQLNNKLTHELLNNLSDEQNHETYTASSGKLKI